VLDQTFGVWRDELNEYVIIKNLWIVEDY